MSYNIPHQHAWLDSEKSEGSTLYTEFSIYRERVKKIQRGGPTESSAEGNSSTAPTECDGLELEALEGKEGLGAAAMQETLRGSVVVTPDTLSNLAFAKAKWAGPKWVPRVALAIIPAASRHQKLLRTLVQCRNCLSLVLKFCSFLLSKTGGKKVKLKQILEQKYFYSTMFMPVLNLKLNGCRWGVWMAVPAWERWFLWPLSQTICPLWLKLSLCILKLATFELAQNPPGGSQNRQV